MSPSSFALSIGAQSSAVEDRTITTDVGDSTSHSSKKMRSTLSTSYSTELYTNSAASIAKQIKQDKDECRFVIETYSLDPHELLHLLERWTQKMMEDFKLRRERFKLILKDKWDRGELHGLKCEEDTKRRSVYQHIEKLTQWKRTSPLVITPYLDDSQMTSDNIKQTINKFIDELLDVTGMVISINEIGIHGRNEDLTKTTCSSAHILETKKQLQRLRELNEKEYNTICIIGLEKAGKSTFINALVGFELLPHKIERCTQIQTVLEPLSRDDANRFATIEFYTDDEFSKLVHKIPKEESETGKAFQERLAMIKDKRKQIVMPNRYIEHRSASNQRDKITQELHSYIMDPLYLNIVKQVVIYTDKLPGQNYKLVDVPGCDSPIEEHRLSAINAVQKSDAFLFLTDGQRPSLTNDQVHLLQEIQSGHFDAMKRAFGIITKLDLCQTRAKFIEHEQKAIIELQQSGFLREKIYSIRANINLSQDNNINVNELHKIQDHIASFGTLSQGFDKCKQAIEFYIEHELPNTHLRQVISIARQKILRYVDNALALGRQLIPIDTEQTNITCFDDYIKQINTERWNDIFTNERYEPVLRRAARWQKEMLVFGREKCTTELKNYFNQQFQACTQDIVNKEHPIDGIMIEQHDIALLQMNPYGIETDERAKITSDMLKGVVRASNELAAFMYDTYVNKLETILNDICPEQDNLFQTALTPQCCSIEVQTLILRTAHPVIMATIRWPHTFKDNRIEAGKEIMRVAPMIAFNVHEDNYENVLTISNNGLSILKAIFSTILKAYVSNGSPMDLATALFRRRRM